VKKHILCASVMIIVAGLFLSFSDSHYTAENPPPANIKYTLRNVAYGPEDRNILDIALPKNRSVKNTPLIIFIHGGAWVLGNKLFFFREMQEFSDSGFACACIDYRFVNNEKKVHHKEITSDILLALSYLRAHSQSFNISPDRIGLMGHSAGAHMSMIVAYALDSAHLIKAVVSWSGPSNFLDPLQPTGEKTGQNVLAVYCGTPLKTSADTAVWKSVSPYYMVKPNSAPTLIVQGDHDNLVPEPMAVKMHARLDSLGVDNKLVVLKGSAHIYIGSGLLKARAESYSWMKAKL